MRFTRCGALRAARRILELEPIPAPILVSEREDRATLLVDRAAVDDLGWVFKHEGEGFARPDRIFDGDLGPALDAFNNKL